MADTEPSLSPEESLARQFYQWELRGRGWQVCDVPVALEPPFRPFFGHYVENPPVGDDGRKPTLVTAVLTWLHRRLNAASSTSDLATIEESEEPDPRKWQDPDQQVELRIALPSDMEVDKTAAEHFLLSLAGHSRVLSFEILGLPDSIHIQIVCDERDADSVEDQLQAFFPDSVVSRHTEGLSEAWEGAGGSETVVAEFGLDREFMLPLAPLKNFNNDPLVGVTGALSGVRAGEVALLQVLFQPVSRPWAESILRSVVFCDGTPFFCGVRDFVGPAKLKIAKPLYGVVIRTACRSDEDGRAWELTSRLAGALSPLADPTGNALIPLDNDQYDPEEHSEDVVRRRSRRTGMILNSDELVSLVHLPSVSVRSAKLRQLLRRSHPAPGSVLGHKLVLGVNDHGGVSKRVTLSPDQRSKHIHAIGASGTGKSTFLLNLITQDIRNGDGVAVLDPHGDLIDAVLERIPPERVKDVVLLDPADEQFPVGFNILDAHSDLEKNLLSSDLVAVFRRLSTSWGDQMTSVLGNAILAFLESTRGGTLLDLRRFLVEPAYRKEFLTTVTDAEVVYYWQKEFQLLTGRPQGPVLTRLDTFLRPKPIRYMVAQKQSRLDFADIMDTSKIFLARLSHGVIGEENSYLLGSLLVSKFHQLALGRQQQKEADRRHFWMYVDEFHQFATPSMGSILSGARKYRLGLVLAHQELNQLEDKAPVVASAVMANAHTRVCFRLGDTDARKLESGFSNFDAVDLQNLGLGEAICRVERAESDFNLRTPPSSKVDAAAATAVREAVIQHSRQQYATPRAEVEAMLVRSRGTEAPVEVIPTAPVAPSPLSEPKQVPPETPPALPFPAEEQGPVEERVTNPSEAPEPDKPKRPRKTISEEATLGRGGPDHKYLQQLIKQWAEGMGYRAEIEAPIADGRAADVLLRKGTISIACEICITTEYAHELENLRKCLVAGFTHVAAISPDPKRLSKLRTFIEPKLDPAERPRVRFVLPDELFAFVQELDIRQLDQEKTICGYKVTTKHRPADGAEAKDRRDAVSDVIAKAIKRMKAKNPDAAETKTNKHRPKN